MELNAILQEISHGAIFRMPQTIVHLKMDKIAIIHFSDCMSHMME